MHGLPRMPWIFRPSFLQQPTFSGKMLKKIWDPPQWHLAWHQVAGFSHVLIFIACKFLGGGGVVVCSREAHVLHVFYSPYWPI